MKAALSDGSAKPRRDVTINIRADRSQRDLIDRAAELQGKTRSEFMLEAADRAAQEVLLDRRLFGLDEEKFQQFVELLDAPLAHPERVRRLLDTKAPWD